MGGSVTLPWLRPFLILALILSVPPLLYWFGHVQRRMDDAQRQNFTTLAAITTQLRDRLEADRNLAERATCSVNKEHALRYLKSILPQSISENVANRSATTRLAVTTNGRLNLQVFDRQSPVCDPNANAETASDNTSPTLQSIVSVELNTLVDWSLVESTFEGLLIFDQDNRLVAQDRRLPAQPLGMPVPLHNGDKTIKLADYAETSRGGSHSQLFASDSDTYLRIAGVDYLPFVQVVSLPAGAVQTHRDGDSTNQNNSAAGAATPASPTSTTAADGTLRLVVCGLVQKQTLRQQAIALSPDQIVCVIAVIALGLLAIPFLKLRFIGPHERVRARDVWLLGISLLCGTTLLLLLVLHASSVTLLRERFDHGLGIFAKTVQERVSDETTQAVAQLKKSKAQLLNTPINEQVTSILTQQQFDTYALFDSLSMVNNKGMQQRKWTTRTISTPMVRVQDRAYFSDAMSNAPDEGYAVDTVISYTMGSRLGVFAIPIEPEQPGINQYSSAFTRSGIVTLATPLYSLNQPLVPEPYQFVVLDKRGQVIFESSQEPYWHERFFESVTNGATLARQALITTDKNTAPDNAIGNYGYRGKIYRMLTRPLPELNATLVVYYDRSVYQTIAAGAFSVAVLFALSLAVSVLISIRIAYCIFGSRALDWAWPSQSQASGYVFGAAVCGLAGLVCLLAWLMLPAEVVMWVLVLTPAVAIITLAFGFANNYLNWIPHALHAKWETLTSQFKDRYAALYVGFAALALLSCTGIPLSLAFDDAVATQTAAFEQTAVRNLQAARNNSNAFPVVKAVSLTNRGLVEMASSPNCNTPADDLRCATTDRIYATQHNYGNYYKQLEAFGLYDANYADSDSLQSRRAYQPIPGPVATDAKAFTWNFTTAQLARAVTVNADLDWSLSRIAGGEPSVSIKSFAKGQLCSFWFWIGLTMLIVVLSLMVRSVSIHIFGLKLIGDGVLANEAEQNSARRLLLLRPSQQVLDDLRKADAPHESNRVAEIDLSTYELTVEEFQRNCDAATMRLILLHVECRLSDRNWRQALLRLVNTAKELVLVSGIDPFHFLAQRLREATEGLLAPDGKDVAEVRSRHAELQEELTQWSAALATVQKIRYGLATDWLKAALPSNAPNALKGQYQRVLYASNVVLTNPELKLKHKLQKLAEECQWSDQLMDIGRHLVARSDFAQYRWSQLAGFIEDAAEPYYRSLWDLCSRDEKLVLIQLAQEGFVNPKNVELVRRLARRRLVSVDPRFRLFNDSFREFVRKVETSERITAWERGGGATTWSRISIPLYAFAAMVIAILLYTEQSFLTDTLAVATVASGTLGSLRSLYAAAKQAASVVKLA